MGDWASNRGAHMLMTGDRRLQCSSVLPDEQSLNKNFPESSRKIEIQLLIVSARA